MNLLSSTTFTWWQLGLLKWAVLCIGLAIGAKFSDIFSQYITLLFIVGLGISAYLGTLWFKQKQQSPQDQRI